MQRREFSLTAVAAASVAITGCGGGGSAVETAAEAPAPVAQDAAVGESTAAVVVPASAAAFGANLSGMEWAESGMRFGGGTVPNIHFTVPRRADVAYLASQGFTKSRLPIKWEMLQPMLHDTVPSAAARAAIGEPGAFHAGYLSYIMGVLDAHAAAGTRCIVDLHNYCRYRDFVFQPDGSVIGLVAPPDPLVRAYTTDNTQVRTRIFALAPGATLTQDHFSRFWAQFAALLKDHPGFGGYGLMNEPFYMPRPGETVEAFQGYGEDLTIWASFAQAAIAAIRAVDPVNAIYLGGNEWSSAMSIAYKNPAWPLAADNIVYEVHTYLDAYSNGQSFDWDSEVAKKYTAGFGSIPLTLNTGLWRIRMAMDWAQAWGVKLALTETGMPIDDPRWEEAFKRMVAYAREGGVEVFTWQGGSHWLLHNRSINTVPGWHQNRTVEPAVAGPLKFSAGIDQAVLFDAGPGWLPSGAPATITVYARGNLVAPLTITVSSSNGGTFDKTLLTIPAGNNGQDSFSFTPPSNAIATLSYRVDSLTVAPPPPRVVYSLFDPVAYAATSLKDAAMAILAKYSACKWELGDGFTDYMLGRPALAGDVVRAIADSGYGSSPGNAMEMLNWVNTDSAAMGGIVPPVMRETNGRKHSDHSAPRTHGFWCRKALPVAGVQPNPRNRVPYNIEDAHFAIAAVSIPGGANTGPVLQASNAAQAFGSELALANGQPQARWLDAGGQSIVLTGASALVANRPAVLSFTSAPAAQVLRVNSVVAGTASATFAPSAYDQLLLGWGFRNYFPSEGFGGHIYAAITGKGAPTSQEMAVLERYLGA